MDDELWLRFEDDPWGPARHRATINARFVENVGKTIQRDDPAVLTDEVMSHIVSTAYMSIFPMFREEVAEAAQNMTDPIVRRAYTNVRTALRLFTNGWSLLSDIGTDRDWEAWIESMSTA